ncbi:non-structural maintenance of chromosomes element 1 homolog [Paramormyrops kingsleyae]|uniref:Non-structural maintenance of chromosomes element 1 homolog n=1 Tax=Paramormyrops kingsleyae TaxID=1676925 RepID=A0A3B3R7W3_9TELE|nr:non-structural maintenance of chromosomes element 1 homolog [Paramormyrops kingsleyae]XP_023672313.1 non-structural maintenance of chromosomes element 1 homolog [Paramormyrops kingsleyae]
MAGSLSDCHRRFLQSLMCNGIIVRSKAIALHRNCCEVHNTHYTRDGLDEFIDLINSHLEPLFMQIRKSVSEEDGLQYYALVNMAETDITRMSSDYADNELELFRKTMDLIVDSESGRASSTDILNCADSLNTRKMKKKETELLLTRLVRDKWLNEKHGEYTLSTRCIMEMEQYIQKIYQDMVKTCAICHNVVFQSQMCDNMSCGIKMHIPCVAKYFKGRSDPQCPVCNAFWPHEIPEIRDTAQVPLEMENTAPTPSTSHSRRRR